MKLVARARATLRALFVRKAADADMDEELRFHVEMETRRLMREGNLDELEARRRAFIAFGGIDKYKEQVRDARGLAWLTGMSLDLKLGLRMLVKYPGLTIVGGLGMALAIAIGAGFFSAFDALETPALPLDDGADIVALEQFDGRAYEYQSYALQDFLQWRSQLKSAVDVSAYRAVKRNLIAANGSAVPVHVAEMTASGFRVARVAPLLGRPLLDQDERAGAADVIVIGHDVWQVRFAGDSAVIGRTVRLGNSMFTIVGVMPRAFAFPVNFQFWTPLRTESPEPIHVFARLAPGRTVQQVEAELSSVAEAEGEKRIPRVKPFTHASYLMFSSAESPWEVYLVVAFISLLLVVVAVNVAVLVYARTATRWGEIAARSALGASRARIVGQLCAEALVLTAVAATLGLFIASFALRYVDVWVRELAAPGGGLPFWIPSIGISAHTVVYTIALAIIGTLIVGVLPALKATGAQLQSSIRQLTGGGDQQLGVTWTVLIVAQVAIAITVLPLAVMGAWEFARVGFADPGYPTEQYLVARLEADGANADYAPRLTELVRRIESQPAVADVTYASAIPGRDPAASIAIERDTGYAGLSSDLAWFNSVSLDFFDAFDVPLLAGRSFGSEDLALSSSSVIVNRAFVQQFFQGGPALGRRIRYSNPARGPHPETGRTERWYEIVGVVGDLPANPAGPMQLPARVYHALPAERAQPAMIAVRMNGTTPAAFAGSLRTIALAVDPTLSVHDLLPLDRAHSAVERPVKLSALAIVLVMLSVLLLSGAGVYALMSFTVNQRRREIGIRAALGASPHSLLASIFAKAIRQLSIGIGVGLFLASALAYAAVSAFASMYSADTGMVLGLVFVMGIVAAAVFLVGTLATFGPARRGLRIQPSEALKGAD